jgi:hypothetical protein
LIRDNPLMSGICEYRADTLPRTALPEGALSHPSIFVNQTLSLINPHFLHPGRSIEDAREDEQLVRFVDKLCRSSRTPL